MDFGMYPPEINSGRMYSGPGPGPMLAAAQAWGSLADELYTAASGYQSVVSQLTEGAWSGPSSAAMSAAAGSYVKWLSATATQSEETAAQARAAAAAYEAAFISTVPPPVIAANRSLLMALVATNFFGQNTPAIALTETHYGQMWAQDAAAMHGYAGSSAAAVVLTPFTSPHQNTDAGASAGQAAAVSQVGGTSAGNVHGVISVVPQALSATAAQAQTDPLSTLANLISVFLNAPTDLTTLFGLIPMDALGGPANIPISFFATAAGLECDETFSGLNGVEAWPGTGPAPVTRFPATLTNLPPGTVPAPMMSAALGEANMVGGLSVPPSWTVAAPEIRSVAMTSAISAGPTAAATPLQAGSVNAFNPMGLAGMAGQAIAGPPAADDSQNSGKAVTHARLATRVPGATAVDAQDDESQNNPRLAVIGIAAELREIGKLRVAGRLTDEEYTEQKNRLLGR